MSSENKTLMEISAQAERILYEHLGLADTIRYLNQFQPRQEVYSETRPVELMEADVDQLMEQIRAKRPKS